MFTAVQLFWYLAEQLGPVWGLLCSVNILVIVMDGLIKRFKRGTVL